MAKMKLFCVAVAAMFLMPPVSMMRNMGNVSNGITDKTIVENIAFSQPVIKEKGKYLSINVEGANSWLREAGKPILPVYSKTFEFPFGTKIVDVKCLPSGIRQKTLSKEIISASEPIPPVSLKRLATKGEKICNSPIFEIFPRSWYDYRIGCGLDGEDRMVFLTIRFYPIRYSPLENLIQYASNAEIKISYRETSKPIVFNDEYDLVIISPSKFSDELKPLIKHKNDHNMRTILVTTEEIYGKYNGRDQPEKIKYFIKDAIERWNISYVLLVGGLKYQGIGGWWLPVRYSYLFWADENRFVSDLYYADIYKYEDGEQIFDDWDSNGNGIFGEWSRSGMEKDELDLIPDVYVGRLPCRNEIEVKIMVDKIIDYERNAYGKEWFKRTVVVGGDNFPDPNTNYYEGEVVTQKALDYLDEFEPVKVWASQGPVDPRSIRKAMENGCGFLFLHGHGSPISWSTHKPGEFDKWCRGLRISNIPFFFNKGLPVTVIGGCHTAMFNISILNHPWTHGIPAPEGLSWWLTRKISGGSIATLGWTDFPVATPGEEGDLDGDGINEPDCVEGGYGYMGLRFFHAYGEKGMEILGECWGDAVKTYATTFDCMKTRWDGHTVEGFVLLGDPSLKIGGYPGQ